MSGPQDIESNAERARLTESLGVREVLKVVGVGAMSEVPIVKRVKQVWKDLNEDSKESKEAAVAMRARANDLLEALKEWQVPACDERRRHKLIEDIESYMKDVDTVISTDKLTGIVRGDLMKDIVKGDQDNLECLKRRYEDLQHEMTRSRIRSLETDVLNDPEEIRGAVHEMLGALDCVREGLEFISRRLDARSTK